MMLRNLATLKHKIINKQYSVVLTIIYTIRNEVFSQGEKERSHLFLN